MSRKKGNLIDYYIENPPKHFKRTHGWTRQVSYCGYAQWWDCSFWCGNPKLNPKCEILSCRLVPGCIGVPNFNQCKKLRRKLK